MMREKNGLGAPLFRNLCKKFVAGFARRRFDRHFLLGCNGAHICRSHFKLNIVLGGQFFDETCVGITRAAAKLMIQMTNDQFFVAALNEEVK